MSFSFWTFVNGAKVSLSTESLFSAPNEARQIGGDAAWGFNPLTGVTFKLAA